MAAIPFVVRVSKYWVHAVYRPFSSLLSLDTTLEFHWILSLKLSKKLLKNSKALKQNSMEFNRAKAKFNGYAMDLSVCGFHIFSKAQKVHIT